MILGETQAYRNLCEVGYYCPTGTGDYLVGVVANDAINRFLNETTANPFYDISNVRYVNVDDVRVISSHDKRCFDGIDTDISLRYVVDWIPEGKNIQNPSITFLRRAKKYKIPYQNNSVLTGYNDGKYYRPVTTSQTIANNLQCGRDHKWRLVHDTIYRNDCNCTNFFHIIISVYRLWKCTGHGILTNFGLGSVNGSYNGGREYWFHRPNDNITTCNFPDSPILNLTSGGIDYNYNLPSIGINNPTRILNISNGIEFQFTWNVSNWYYTYAQLKQDVYEEYYLEYKDLTSGTVGRRINIDPYIFDLKRAIEKVEEYADRLRDLIWLVNTTNVAGQMEFQPGRLDMCECQNLMKCPNGTSSVAGSISWTDCKTTLSEIIRRVNIVPSWYNETYPDLEGYLVNSTDFWELTGGSVGLKNGTETYKLGSIVLEAFDVAVLTLDFRKISQNLTYGTDYRIAVYVDCKPCPTLYQCDYTATTPTCPSSPTIEEQTFFYDQCLKRYTKTSCMNYLGKPIDCSNTTHVYNVSTFQEPDLYKCQQIPYFCDAQQLPKQIWDIKIDQNTGFAKPTSIQQQSSYITDPNWQLEVNAGLISSTYQYIPGCCACEPQWMPYYFRDSTTVDDGFLDNKHDFIQFSVLAVEHSSVTFAVELLNGQYVQDFDATVPDMGDIYIHRPSRARYNPVKPSRDAFMVLMSSSLFSSIQQPLNLPISTTRNPGQAISTYGPSDTYTLGFETSLLIGRTVDLYQSDPRYEARYRSHKIDLFIDLLLQGENVTEFEAFANIPDLKTISNSLYSVLTPYAEYSSYSPSSFYGLPYLPFFSNCKGSGQFLSLAKALETDPYCDLISYENTVPVSPYPWTGEVIPNADKCNRTTLPNEVYRQVGNQTIKWLDKYHGALFECSFEEEINIASQIPR